MSRVTGDARRDLRLLCTGVAVSTAGTAMTGLAVLVHLRPFGSLAVAAGLAAAIAPAATGAFWAGPLVDRHPSRPLVAAAAGASAAALTLAALTALDADRVLLLLTLVLGMGAGAAVVSPALAALVPAVVGEEGATRGYGSYGAARSAGTLVGFALGGLVVDTFGVPVALLLDAASFVVLSAAVFAVRRDRRPAPTTPGDRHHRPLAGVVLLRRDTVLRVAVTSLALAAAGAVLVDVAGVFYVLDVVPSGSPTVFGAASAAWGVGSLAGAKVAGRLDDVPRLVRGLALAHVTMALALAVCGLVPSVAVLLATWLVGGTANGAQNVCVQALVRERSDPGMRGRAFAASTSLVQASTAVGLGAGAAVVPVLGAQGAVVASAALPAVAGAAVVLRFPRRS